jgi:hypothetical protein
MKKKKKIFYEKKLSNLWLRVRDSGFRGHHSWVKRGIIFFTKTIIKILRVEGGHMPPSTPLPSPLPIYSQNAPNTFFFFLKKKKSKKNI